jgi:transcriptional regulator with GAF, ATPase, and Fis domain
MKRQTFIAYILTILLLLSLFLILNLIFTRLTIYQTIPHLLAALVVLLLLNPLLKIIDVTITRLINKKQVFLQIQLNQLQAEVTYITHLLRLQRVLIRRVAELMHVQAASLFLLDEVNAVYELSDGLGVTQKDKRKIQFQASGGLLVWLRMEKKALYLPKLQRHERFQYLGKEEKEKISRLQSELVIPMIFGGDVVGLLLLGPKPHKASYTSDEIKLLQEVANHAAQAIINATAHRDLTSMDREIIRYQNRIRALEAKSTEYQKSYQALMDYIKTGILVMKTGDQIVDLNQSFRDSILPDLNKRFEEFLFKKINEKPNSK